MWVAAQNGKEILDESGTSVGVVDGTLFSAEGPTATINTLEMEAVVQEAVTSLLTYSDAEIELLCAGKGDDFAGVTDSLLAAQCICCCFSNVGVVFNKTKVHAEIGMAEAERCFVDGKHGYRHAWARKCGSVCISEPQGVEILNFRV